MNNEKMINRREFLRMSMVGAAGLVLASCGGAAPAPTETPASAGPAGELSKDVSATLTTFNWGNPDEAKAYAAAFARFNQEYPNVKVADNLTPVTSWSEYADKLATQVAGGNPPDIINIAIEGVQLGVSKGLLMPLDDFIANDPEAKEFIAQIPKPLVDALSVDGKLYEIPNGWQTMVIHYNTKMFQDKGIDPPKPDWTWDDFLNIAQELTSGEGSDKIFGFGLPWGFFQLHPWWLTNGSYPVTADYKASNLNDPKFIEAVTFIHDLVKVHGVSPDPIGLNVYDQFGAGRFAMVGAGRWVINGWKASGFTDFDIVPWPQKAANQTVFGCAGWGISPQSKNPQLAWEVVKHLVDPQTISDTMKLGQQIPILESVAQDPAFLEVPANAKLFFDVGQTAKAVASPPFFTDLERITMRHLEEVITGAASPEAGMMAAHEELQAKIG